MDDATMDIVTGIAVPAASILVSTWVAIRLARSDLATLNTINLLAESFAEPMRELRVALTENTWARDFANKLRLWRRRGASDAELRSLIDSATARLTGASSA